MGRATLIGFSAVAMWSLLALFTDASGTVPPFLLSAITFSIGTAVGLVARLFKPAADERSEHPAPGLDHRHCRPVRLPFLLFHRAAQCAGGRGQPDRLSLAAADRARLGADAGRAAALESCRRRAARSCRHGPDRHQGRRAGFEARYAFGYAMAGVCAFLWSAYSLLSRRFAAVSTIVVTGFCLATAALSLALPSRRWRTTVWPRRHRPVARGARPWPDAGRRCLLCLGLRRQERQYPDARCRELRRTAAVDAGADRFRLCRTILRIALACLLVTGGAVLAAKDIIFRDRSSATQPAE